MSTPPVFFSETNDVYLQLLGDAQRVADKQLAQMVIERLKGAGHRHSGSGSAIIPFPRPLLFAAEASEVPEFWQEDNFWPTLIQFLFLLVFGATWIILPFILTGFMLAT